ncbi:MAG: hypothetical protein OES78_04820 [Chromatiales bacterium]|nr:hypothetical protein [Chromatiales bacterium]MDH3933509.1 hypothetical protein [Chromatiales bacterium]MDH3945842.1 hypothetical protein [Chromatiales bacterium]PLX56137.1 MAG: hypothetical protein C0629_08950 [Chromatiales bacterium]
MKNVLVKSKESSINRPMILLALIALTLAAGALVGKKAFADDYPNGCVSCHVEGTGALDMRINAVLSRLGHGKAADRSKVIPAACDRCHASSGDGPASALRNLIHRAHYTDPDANLFVTQYAGSCLHCHAMDGASGKASVKSGERNWTPIVGGEPITE